MILSGGRVGAGWGQVGGGIRSKKTEFMEGARVSAPKRCPRKFLCEVLTPQNVTIFGIGSFNEVIEMEQVLRVGPGAMGRG